MASEVLTLTSLRGEFLNPALVGQGSRKSCPGWNSSIGVAGVEQSRDHASLGIEELDRATDGGKKTDMMSISAEVRTRLLPGQWILRYERSVAATYM